ncbi:hypothetical protein PUV54_13065 [Hyphococcus flavus]|uniref:Uncharacterized protein n=1 Tax=Hyphococcus flavus TaxID=1866326 RepID=A0AAE9ZIF2_9PROT|nr:hypothetical protein [Hyphococcus flavus]WDI30885.1 hypothetical protein PUV54_13065 [Hyphococcus flavus]
MNRVLLPDGVAPTNDKTELGGEADLDLPDTATPAFASPQKADPAPQTMPIVQQTLKRGKFDRFVEDDDDEDDRKKDDVNIVNAPHTPGPLLLLIAIGLVLAALAAFAMSNKQEPLPLCADLPEWNQYNCRAG